MTVPYEYRKEGVQWNQGDKLCVKLDVPSRGTLHKLIVVQTGGTPADFDINLFSSRHVCPPDDSGGVSSSSSSAGQTAARELYKVIPTQSATNNVVEYFNEDGGIPYINADGTPTNQERALYLEIIPAGAAPAEFDIAALVKGVDW